MSFVFGYHDYRCGEAKTPGLLTLREREDVSGMIFVEVIHTRKLNHKHQVNMINTERGNTLSLARTTGISCRLNPSSPFMAPGKPGCCGTWVLGLSCNMSGEQIQG